MESDIDKIRQKIMRDLMTSNKQQVSPVDLTDSTFISEISRDGVMVVDFWAPWCGPCRFVSPIVEELARDYAGKARFGKVNVDENPVISSRFDIRSIPTIMFFKNGKPVDVQIGAVPRQILEAKLKRLLN
ncbi:MAG: thioredoxin [Thermoplasmataceae archaeon]